MNLRLAFPIFALCASPICLADIAEPAYKTGSYTERTTLVSLVGEAGAQSLAGVLDPNHEFEFDVYVPENYGPSSPAGLLVYVSPIDSGEIPGTWKQGFDRRNLIWVSVNRSGNTISRERRVAEAKVSVAFILQNYGIDPQRIYISGMSGGGQISSIVASLYPSLFRGGIFLCGVNPWSEGDADPWLENPPENFDAIKENRYVFLSGTEDFKLAATERVYRIYKKAGVESSKLIVIENMGHELPDARNFDRALGFLDTSVAVSEVPVHVETQ
jgi:predicted esterase